MKRFQTIYVLAFLALGLTSCLEDENIEEQKYGIINLDANKIIEIPSATKNFSLLIENKATTLEAINVHLAANDVAAEDIKVTLALDPASTYPASKYTLPEGLVVTIPKGSRDGVLKVNMNPQDLDPSTPYTLIYSIASVDKPGYIISGNYAKRTVKVAARNAYEGTYKATGVFTHPTAGPRAIDRDKKVTTINATTSRIEIGDLASANYYMYIRVNADNTVTILPDPSAVTQNVFPNGVNTYNPATKSFTLNYGYSSAAPRLISEVVVLK